MTHIAVFCGSSTGRSNFIKQQAMQLGKELAARNIALVYGGASIGLMGAVADGVLSEGGKVIGILPEFLSAKEIAHENLTEMILVKDMHERKARMNELSDGVIALPGGFGTMEELFEMLTWAQLGLHKKPVSILNLDGFYDPLIELFGKMEEKGFLSGINRRMLLVEENIDDLLNKMEKYVAPEVGKWLNR
ncbi:MAG: TIGR00730 family Rossman fold protein [Bacteroidales bacterium]